MGLVDEEDDSDVPESGGVFTFGKTRFNDDFPGKFWVKNDKVVFVACGDGHTVLITESGRIFTFGANEFGQLGIGSRESQSKPRCVKAMKEKERAVLAACGRAHTLISTESGRVYSFGANSDHQLGSSSQLNEEACPTPVQVDGLPFPAQILTLAAGADLSAVLLRRGDSHDASEMGAGGEVYVWGSGTEGELGLGQLHLESSATTHLNLDEPVAQLSLGYHHTAILTVSGKLYTHGEGEFGKLGHGDEQSHFTPSLVRSLLVPVESGGEQLEERVVAVACGGSHTLAITELFARNDQVSVPLGGGGASGLLGQRGSGSRGRRGFVYAWGDGNCGQLGRGNRAEEGLKANVPARITAFEKLRAQPVAIAAGQSHSALITEEGVLYMWGDGRHGKLALQSAVAGGSSASYAEYRNEYLPLAVRRFQEMLVEQVALGGLHSVVRARRRPPLSVSVLTTPDALALEQRSGTGQSLPALSNGSNGHTPREHSLPRSGFIIEPDVSAEDTITLTNTLRRSFRERRRAKSPAPPSLPELDKTQRLNSESLTKDNAALVSEMASIVASKTGQSKAAPPPAKQLSAPRKAEEERVVEDGAADAHADANEPARRGGAEGPAAPGAASGMRPRKERSSRPPRREQEQKEDEDEGRGDDTDLEADSRAPDASATANADSDKVSRTEAKPTIVAKSSAAADIVDSGAPKNKNAQPAAAPPPNTAENEAPRPTPEKREGQAAGADAPKSPSTTETAVESLENVPNQKPPQTEPVPDAKPTEAKPPPPAEKLKAEEKKEAAPATDAGASAAAGATSSTTGSAPPPAPVEAEAAAAPETPRKKGGGLFSKKKKKEEKKEEKKKKKEPATPAADPNAAPSSNPAGGSAPADAAAAAANAKPPPPEEKKKKSGLCSLL